MKRKLISHCLVLAFAALMCGVAPSQAQDKKPNILFIMSDDHGYQAISAYGSKVNKTPNIDRLAALYPAGGDVTPDDLVAKGAVRSGELVKVLGTGETDGALRVSAHAFSESAKAKITAAGGTVTEL